MRTDKQVVTDGNVLAMKFYRHFGYVRDTLGKDFKRNTFRFDKSTNPKEREMWELAAIAYEFIEGTDIEDALTGLPWDT